MDASFFKRTCFKMSQRGRQTKKACNSERQTNRQTDRQRQTNEDRQTDGQTKRVQDRHEGQTDEQENGLEPKDRTP